MKKFKLPQELLLQLIQIQSFQFQVNHQAKEQFINLVISQKLKQSQVDGVQVC